MLHSITIISLVTWKKTTGFLEDIKVKNNLDCQETPMFLMLIIKSYVIIVEILDKKHMTLEKVI